MTKSQRKGGLFLLSAPSAAGKTTLIRRLFELHPDVAAGLTFSVSHTTRPAREGEVDGRDYHFVDEKAFDDLVAADGFLEWAVVHGRRYGTSREAVETQRARGYDVLLDIDVQGADQVSERQPDVPRIFVLPPSFEVLEQRLRRRGLDSADQVERRLVNARSEVQRARDYEYVILNDELDRACGELASVFVAERCRRDRMQGILDEVLRASESILDVAIQPRGSEAPWVSARFAEITLR